MPRTILSFSLLSALSLAFPASASDLGACQGFYPQGHVLSEGRTNPARVSALKPLKGQVQAEPTFGTCEVRVTDHATEAPSSFARNDYSRRQAFNANETYQIVYSNDGFWHLYNARTFAHIKRLTGPAGDAEPQWHPTRPELLYYVPTNGGTRLMVLDVDSNTSSVAADFAGRLPSWAASASHIWTKSEGSPSADGRYWGFQVENANFGILGYAVWDLTNNALVGARPATLRPDHVSMSASGRWFVTSDDTEGTWAWSPDFSVKKKLHHKSEHSDLALLANGNDAYVAVDYQTNAGDVFYTDIDACPSVPASATTAPICPRVVLFPSYVNGAATALHVSGKGYGKPGWVVFSMYAGSASRDGTYPWFTDKVFISELAPNPRTYHLAYSHAVPNGYWTEPHASVSRSFERVAFNSNWQTNSSTDVDTYVIHVPATAFGDTAPTPACSRQAPTLSWSSASSTGGPGAPVNHTLRVRNNDSQGCAATTFSLSGQVPSGWQSAMPSSLSVSAGNEGVATWTVTPPSTVSAGTYALRVSVSSAQAVHATQATVSHVIAAPSCQRLAPTIGLTGSTSPVAAGSSITYQASVKNNDAAGCPATTFNLAASAPSGWTRTLSASQATLSPGQSANATLTVASPSSAAAGGYGVSVGVASPQGAIHTASASQLYTVATPACARRAPSLTLTGGEQAVSAGTQVTYQLRVTNNDTASCSSTAFTLGSSAPSGWTKSLSAASLSLAPGQTGAATLSVRSSASAPANTYAVSASTRSSRSTLHTQQASATYRTVAACQRSAPTVTYGQAVKSGNTYSIPMSLKNNDTAACGGTYFAFNPKAPAGTSGWVVYFSTSGSTIAPGATWTSTLLVTPSAGSSGTHAIPVGHSSNYAPHVGSTSVPLTVR